MSADLGVSPSGPGKPSPPVRGLVPDAAQCEPMHPDAEGWSEWIHPLPGYLMQCCDCGLIHEMEFNIAAPHAGMGDADRNPGEGDDGVVIFRARRQPADTSALRRMVALDEELGLYDDGEVVPPREEAR